MSKKSEPGPPIRGNIRQAGFRRVAHGTFVPVVADPDPTDEFHRDLAAWLLVLPPGAAFTHLTAASLMGWQLPPRLPDHLPVFAAVGLKDARPRRPGLVCSRLTRRGEVTHWHGLPVEAACEVLLRAARDLGILDLVILIDSARRLGHIDEEAMRATLASRRPGVRKLRAAWDLSCAGAESAGESILHTFDRVMNIKVDPQVQLFDDRGNLVAVVDLLVVGTRLVHEYDGSHHRRGHQHSIDLRRDRALSRAGYERRGFTLSDLVTHPAVTMHELDRDVGRPHDLDRLARWRRLVETSLLDEGTRRRATHRWSQHMGIPDGARAG